MKNVRLLIFDWDGTLADSAGPIVTEMQAAISALRLPSRSDLAIRELIGLGWDDALRRLFPELELAEVARMLLEYRRRSPPTSAHEAPLFEGALDTLGDLSRAGFRLAVATGKPRPGLQRSFEAHPRLASLFEVTRCADETASKPDPLMLRQILDETGCAAVEALMIGDTEYDIAMARALGMPALGVACGVHEPGRLLQSGAAAVVDDVRALPVWLGRFSS
jgi:phosphoglycolate phosphatase